MSAYILTSAHLQRPKRFRTLIVAMRALMELKYNGEVVDTRTGRLLWRKTEACYEDGDGRVLSDIEYEEAVSDQEYEFRD